VESFSMFVKWGARQAWMDLNFLARNYEACWVQVLFSCWFFTGIH